MIKPLTIAAIILTSVATGAQAQMADDVTAEAFGAVRALIDLTEKQTIILREINSGGAKSSDIAELTAAIKALVAAVENNRPIRAPHRLRVVGRYESCSLLGGPPDCQKAADAYCKEIGYLSAIEVESRSGQPAKLVHALCVDK